MDISANDNNKFTSAEKSSQNQFSVDDCWLMAGSTLNKTKIKYGAFE